MRLWPQIWLEEPTPIHAQLFLCPGSYHLALSCTADGLMVFLGVFGFHHLQEIEDIFNRRHEKSHRPFKITDKHL